MVFVDLEKAYATVPREVLWICMRKQNIPEEYIILVQDMYQGATTRVKSKRGMSEHFEVGICLHQGSALFIMPVDTISQDVRTELPWELIYAVALNQSNVSKKCVLVTYARWVLC